MTEYIVLRAEPVAEEASLIWQEVGRVDAQSAERAMRAEAKADGIYVAVPARSWQPRQRRVEVKEISHFEQTSL